MEKYNGWIGREVIDCYLTYCKTIFERYKDKVKYWLTFNEINMGTLPHGNFLAICQIKDYTGPVNEIPDNEELRFQALHHQFVASALAVRYAHEHYPQFKLGDMNLFATCYPLTPDPEDVLACQPAGADRQLVLFGRAGARRISQLYPAVFLRTPHKQNGTRR